MARFKTCTKWVCSVAMLAALACGSYARAEEAKPRMKLGAYYFAGWSGTNPSDDGKPEHAWAKGMPSHYTQKLATEYAGRTPIWGWRDDTEELMQRQIDLAAENGISFFSFCWYWHDNKKPINLKAIDDDDKHLPMQLFMKAKTNSRMEFCLLVANHGGYEIVGPAAWKQAADYWITLFKHPRYLKVGGKPLLVIFSPKGANAEGLAYLQTAAKEAGFPGVAVACCGKGKPEEGYSIKTVYNAVPGDGKHKSEAHPYDELIAAHEKTWVGTPEQRCIPVLSVGWDRRPWEGVGGFGPKGVTVSWYFEGKTPEAFGGALSRMANWMDANPDQCTPDRLALVYAWNEIGEGGWLVPCKDDPNGAYLKAIRRVVLGK